MKDGAEECYKVIKNKWHTFDACLGNKQKLPSEKKYVLVRCILSEDDDGIVVGILKYAAGDKSAPYFVTFGFNQGKVIAWCDCLDEELIHNGYNLKFLEEKTKQKVFGTNNK